MTDKLIHNREITEFKATFFNIKTSTNHNKKLQNVYKKHNK